MKFRIEKDTLGEVQVPADKYWGAQTERSRNNFKIGPEASMPLEIIRAYALIKKACAKANTVFAGLDSVNSSWIERVCDEISSGQLDDHFPLVIWQTGSGTQTNMNVNEVIANRAQVLAGLRLGDDPNLIKANDDVNRSQSSNDTFPTAMHIAAYEVLARKVLPVFVQLHEALEEKSLRYADLVKVGRTHMMDATPLTFGQELSAYATQLNQAIRAIKYSMEALAELALGATAVGTGLNAPDGFATKAISLLAEESGHPFVAAPNRFEAIASHDAILNAHAALKQAAVALMKMANDFRLLASGPRSGFAEIVLPANEPGSSIMPGKVNPTQIEALTMVCCQVIGNDSAITVGAFQGHLQLNVFKPMIISNFLQSANLLADAVESFNVNCLQGLVPDPDRMAELLDRSLMLVTALNPVIGYYKAAEIAQKAWKNGTTLKEEAVSLGYLTPEAYDDLVDPIKMTGKKT